MNYGIGKKVSDKAITSRSKGVLDSSGETAGEYKTALKAIKLLSASVSHGDKSHSVLAVQQLTEQSRQQVVSHVCIIL